MTLGRDSLGRTYFCYDYADRLVSSSNPLYDDAAYDSHGNMTALGTYGSSQQALAWIGYDSSDRATGFEQYTDAGNGKGLYYDRDVQGRIMGRYASDIQAWNWTSTGTYFYHYTASGDTPDYVRNSNWDIIEKTLQLPGGVNVTIKPQESQTNNKKQYSLPNIHGDTLLTTNAAGQNTSNGNGPNSAFTYDPFGNVLQGSVLPANTAGGSYGYVGQHQKVTETSFTLTPIQMGARTYFPTLGRFAQVDPVEGGTENNYSYPVDPVNEQDLSGMCPICVPLTMIAGKVALQAISKQMAKEAAKQSLKRVAARDVAQQIALREARKQPGKVIIKSTKINDPKFRGGWEKRNYVLRGSSGRKIDVCQVPETVITLSLTSVELCSPNRAA